MCLVARWHSSAFYCWARNPAETLLKVEREATKVGVQVYDKVKELAAEAREEATALIEEAKSEANNGKGNKVSAKKSED